MYYMAIWSIFLQFVIVYGVDIQRTSLNASSCNEFQHDCVPGDYMLGGLFDLHVPNINDSAGYTEVTCAPEVTDAVLLAEAMVYTISQINHNDSLLKGITLGYFIQDSCADGIQDMLVGLDVYNQLETTNLDIKMNSASGIPIAAMIGPSTNAASESIASLFRLKNISIISYQASDPTLSSITRFPSFYRTTFDDSTQSDALFSLFKHYGWTYIAIVASDDLSGRNGVYEFKERLWADGTICIVVELYVDLLLNTILHDIQINKTISELINSDVNITLIYIDDSDYALDFLTAVQEKRSKNPSLKDMYWIGISEWAASSNLNIVPSGRTKGTMSPIFGTKETEFIEWIRVPQNLFGRANQSDMLLDYLCGICTSGYRYVVYEETIPQCTIEYLHNNCVNYILSYMEFITLEHSYLSRVIDAVYAAAYALDMMQPQVYQQYNLVDHTGLNNAMKKVNFQRNLQNISFDINGDLCETNFAIHNFYQYSTYDAKASRDQIIGHWKSNCNYDNSPNNLELDGDAIVWTSYNSTGEPKSTCNDLCPAGHRTINGSTSCCWACEKCEPRTYSNTSGSYFCHQCPDHTHSNQNLTGCDDNTRTYFSWTEPVGLIYISFAVFWDLIITVSAIIGYIWRKHPIFASGGTYDYVVLFNSAVGFHYIISYSGEPSNMLCAVRRGYWSLLLSAHCIASFVFSEAFRKFTKLVRKTGINIIVVARCQLVAFSLLSIIGVLYVFLINWFVVPYQVDYVDLGSIRGEWSETYVECSWFYWEIIAEPGYAMIFWFPSLFFAYRRWAGFKRRRNSRQSWSEMDAVSQINQDQLILYTSYSVLFAVMVLAPLFLTTNDPWFKTFVVLLGAQCLNAVVFMFHMFPRFFRLFFKKDYAISSSVADRQNRRFKLDDVFMTSSSMILNMNENPRSHQQQKRVDIEL